MLHAVLFSILLMVIFVNVQSDVSKSCQEKEKSLASLDLANEAISKAKGLYPDCHDSNVTSNTSVCGKKEKSLGYIEVAMNLISEARENYPTCPPPKSQKLHSKPMDCSEVLENGENMSGVYTIWPRTRISLHKSLDVHCDMDTDGGGWTVIQRRGNFSQQENFYRNWEDYKTGFGNITKDFWIGNDNIFTLSNQGPYSVRFDMQDVSGNTNFSLYRTFWIEDEMSNYTLHIANYSGNAGDSMTNIDGIMFSTKDRKNDIMAITRPTCANSRQSGWWFQQCSSCNPNGLYKPGVRDIDNYSMIYWGSWKGYVGLAAMEIKLRTM